MSQKNKRKELNSQAERKYLMFRLRRGFITLGHSRVKRFNVFLYALIVLSILYHITIGVPTPYIETTELVLFTASAVTGFLVMILIFGTPRGMLKTCDGLIRVGFVNRVSEPPLLLSRRKDPTNKLVTILEFYTSGLELKAWNDNVTKIESILNFHIVRISQDESRDKVQLYTVPGNVQLPSNIIWRNSYLRKQDFELVLGVSLLGQEIVDLNVIPHMLIGGATGSGKTVLMKLLLAQCLLKGAKVYICDFKGGVDFPLIWHKKCNLITAEKDLLEVLTSMAEELERRKLILREVGCANISEYNQRAISPLPRVVIAFDELAEVLDRTGLDKNQKEVVASIENRIAKIARLGRFAGIHLLIGLQRPDANILNGQIKNNVNCRVCGRADSVLSQIILDTTDAATLIPKDARGRFLTHTGVVFQSYWFNESDIFNER